jgi:uncharacterized protein (DUF58 family)
MLPRPSSSCLALIVGLVGLLLVGVGLESAAVTRLSAAGFVLLASAYVATYPLARRARAERLEFAWWLAPRGAGADAVVVPGAPIEVSCFLRHRAGRRIRVVGLAPVLPAGLVVVERRAAPRHAGPTWAAEGRGIARRDPLDWVEPPPGARCEFSLSLVASSVGRHVAQGLAARVEGPLGLFGMPLYFPYPLPLKVLPRSARALRSPPRRPKTGQGTRGGRVHFHRRGGGSELRELRELVPGDPFKAIAWKASARYGKLVVREVEHEVDSLRFVALDVGPSMRGGPLGARKLDLALDWVSVNAESGLREGDRFAAATFDRRIVAKLAPGEGRAHMLRVLDLLLGTTELVDDDLTDVDDVTVAAYVARYLRHQMGLDFHAAIAGGGARGARPSIARELVRHVESLVGEDLGAVQAADRGGRLLRRFCQLRGLALPYRAHSNALERTAALGEALALVHRPSAQATQITVITDGEALSMGDELYRRIGGLRAHGHVVRFVLLRTGEVAEAAESPLGAHLAAVHRAREDRRLDALRAKLTRWGVPTETLAFEARAEVAPLGATNEEAA